LNQAGWHRGLKFSLILIAMQFATSTFLAPRSDAEGAAGSVSATEVAAGLERIQSIAEDVARVVKSDKSKAQKVDAGIEPEWKKIEDTVRATDSETYLSLEDAFASLEDAAMAGDATKAAQASSAISTSVKSYLAQHPGAVGAVAPETTVPAPTSPPAQLAESTAPPSATPPTPPARQAETAAPVAAAPQASRAAATSGLPRTGPRATSALLALAGSVLASGGLALIGGAGRRRKQ
jgi:hypothetical protein